MKKALVPLSGVILCLVGLALVFAPGWIGLPETAIDGAAIVRESRDQPKLTREQLVWINSATLRDEVKAKGFALQLLDPEVTDRDDKTPDELQPYFDAAPPLPSLVLKRGKSYSRVDLPANLSDAKGALGL